MDEKKSDETAVLKILGKNIVKSSLLNNPFHEHVLKQREIYLKFGFLEPEAMIRKISKIRTDSTSEDFEKYKMEMDEIIRKTVEEMGDGGYQNNLRTFFDISRECIDPEVLNKILLVGLGPSKIKQSGRISYVLNQAESDSFEKKIRVANDVLLDSFESWYKPLLTTVIKVGRLLSESKSDNVPSQLGQLVNEALESKIIPGRITDKYIRIMRNSIGHNHTVIDIDEEKVTYINLRRNGSEEKTRPFSYEQLSDFIFIYFSTCRHLTTEIRRCARLLASEE